MDCFISIFIAIAAVRTARSAPTPTLPVVRLPATCSTQETAAPMSGTGRCARHKHSIDENEELEGVGLFFLNFTSS